MALRALDARASFRVKPWLKNPWLDRQARRGPLPPERVLALVAARPEPAWQSGTQPPGPPDTVYWVERGFCGHNLFTHAGVWYGLPEIYKTFDIAKARRGGYRGLIRAGDVDALQAAVLDRTGGEDPADCLGPLDRLVRKFRAQPLRRLPGRVWRKGRRLLGSLRPVEPPWERVPGPPAGMPT
jgi:hypothetical protein